MIERGDIEPLTTAKEPIKNTEEQADTQQVSPEELWLEADESEDTAEDKLCILDPYSDEFIEELTTRDGFITAFKM